MGVRLLALAPVPMLLLWVLAPHMPLPLRYLVILSAAQLGLDLVVKSRASGTMRHSIRQGELSTVLVRWSKRLQGFHPDHLFEYREIGSDWSGCILVFAAWLGVFNVTSIQKAALVMALTAAMHLLPVHTIALLYTGRDGRVHGAGLNVYIHCGRFQGERWLALDWHEEKLSERGSDGRYLPRSRQRTVNWPHVHLCAWQLEFWPWDSNPTDANTTARQMQAQQREGMRLVRQQRDLGAGIDLLALEVAMEKAASGANLPTRLTSGMAVSELALELAQSAVGFALAAAGVAEKTNKARHDEAHQVLLDAARSLAGRRVGQALGHMRKASANRGSVGCASVSVVTLSYS